MELGLVKFPAKLFGTEADDLQGAAGTQVRGFWQLTVLSTCLPYFKMVSEYIIFW